MSEITPPSPPSQPPSSSAPPPTAAIPNPPAALVKELSLGARLDVIIAGTTPKGLVEIETAFGRIALQTNFPLPPDGSLQLQLTAKGPTLLFLITAIHGLQPKAALRSLGLLAVPSPKAGVLAGQGGITPSAGGPQGSTPSAASILITGSATAGRPIGSPALGNLAVGATLTATLLKAGPAGPAAPGGAAPTGGVPGTAGQAGQAGPGPGSSATGTPGARPAQAAVSTPSPSSPSSSLATPGASAGGTPHVSAPSSFPPGTIFSIRITAFQPAAPGASSGATGGAPSLVPPEGGSLTPGGTITGVVIGRASPLGHLIVQTHGGSVTVATQTPASTGSTITFEVLSQSPPTAGTSAHPGVHVSPMAQLLAGRWPGLENAVRTLEELNPAAAGQLLHAVLPRPGLTLGANILFFLAALTGGDLRAWIGDGPARILLKNRPDLMGRLRDDFGRLRTIADEPRAGDWRAILIPLLNGSEIEQIRLFTRGAGEQEEDDADKGRKGTRFIVELNLTTIGRFQLDGLVYEKEKQLDLIVRTETKLPQKMHDDIRDIFINANSVTGLTGGIVFQAAPPNFIEVEGLDPEPENLGLIV